MEVTLKLLEEKSACKNAVERFKELYGEQANAIKVLEKCIEIDKLDWANWLIVRLMTYKQYVSYAVFAAEQVLCIFEKKYPKDKRPREAIEAAKKCIKNPSKENKNAAANAAYAANAAANAADAADAANAAYAADAANAAANAAYAANAAANAADAAYAANAAANAAYAAAKKKMRIKILKYGIKLLKTTKY